MGQKLLADLKKRDLDQQIPKGPMRAITLIKVAKTIDKSMKKHVDFRNYLTCTDLGVFAVISEINLKKMGLVQPN